MTKKLNRQARRTRARTHARHLLFLLAIVTALSFIGGMITGGHMAANDPDTFCHVGEWRIEYGDTWESIASYYAGDRNVDEVANVIQGLNPDMPKHWQCWQDGDVIIVPLYCELYGIAWGEGIDD